MVLLPMKVTNPFGDAGKPQPLSTGESIESCGLFTRYREVSQTRIKRYKPPISATAKPFRVVRRLQSNPTYTPLMMGPMVNAAVLAALSATSAMSGLTLGVCMRLAGL